MDTINLSRTASGGYLRTINGASPRFCSGIRYDSSSDGIKLLTDTDQPLTNDYLVPLAWTIEGQGGYTTIEQVCQALDLIRPENFNGICNGMEDVTPSDTLNLSNPGYLEIRGVAGNIHFSDMLGNEHTKAFEKNECTKFRARKVFETDTTATGMVCYF